MAKTKENKPKKKMTNKQKANLIAWVPMAILIAFWGRLAVDGLSVSTTALGGAGGVLLLGVFVRVAAYRHREKNKKVYDNVKKNFEWMSGHFERLLPDENKAKDLTLEDCFFLKDGIVMKNTENLRRLAKKRFSQNILRRTLILKKLPKWLRQ